MPSCPPYLKTLATPLKISSSQPGREHIHSYTVFQGDHDSLIRVEITCRLFSSVKLKVIILSDDRQRQSNPV